MDIYAQQRKNAQKGDSGCNGIYILRTNYLFHFLLIKILFNAFFCFWVWSQNWMFYVVLNKFLHSLVEEENFWLNILAKFVFYFHGRKKS